MSDCVAIQTCESATSGVRARNLPWPAEERHEEQQHQIGIHLRLQLQVAGISFIAGRRLSLLNFNAACRAWLISSTKAMSALILASLKPERGSCFSSCSMSQLNIKCRHASDRRQRAEGASKSMLNSAACAPASAESWLQRRRSMNIPRDSHRRSHRCVRASAESH